jgi:hypothetical protein
MPFVAFPLLPLQSSSMRRRLFNLFSAFSFLLLFVTLALWIRTYFAFDSATRAGASPARVTPEISAFIRDHSEGGYDFDQRCTLDFWLPQGAFLLRFESDLDLHDRWPNRYAMYPIWRFQTSAARSPQSLPIPRSGFASALNFTYHNEIKGQTLGVDDHVFWLGFPLWFPSLIFIILPALFLYRHRKSRRHDGLCPNCTYDLRASKGRCPECGTLIPSSPAPPPAPSSSPPPTA